MIHKVIFNIKMNYSLTLRTPLQLDLTYSKSELDGRWGGEGSKRCFEHFLRKTRQKVEVLSSEMKLENIRKQLKTVSHSAFKL